MRIFIDPPRLDKWPEIRDWFFKLKSKKGQDLELLLSQIRDAGSDICGMQKVKVSPRVLKRSRRGGFAVCSLCNESYPEADGEKCLACQGENPYES